MTRSNVHRSQPVPDFRGLAALALTTLCLVAAPPTGAQTGDGTGVWASWASESVSLQPRESFQMRVAFQDIPVRRWKLVVDGGGRNCDLSILRTQGEELLYYKTDESRHEVSIPWGKEEELIVVLTNRHEQAGFAVSLMGPPRDQVTAAYSYHVNRALEAYSSGRRIEAETQVRLALRQDPADGVAKVLYAGFERDRNAYEHAALLVDEALAGELPAEMRSLALDMRDDLIKLRAPLPAPVRNGLAEAETHITAGEGQQALEICEKLLDGHLELDGPSHSQILTLKGRALEILGRDYEAVDAFTNALNYDRSKDNQALIYFFMGRLFYNMDNLAQAQGAFTIALQQRLPSGLDVQAREMLQDIEKRMTTDR